VKKVAQESNEHIITDDVMPGQNDGCTNQPLQNNQKTFCSVWCNMGCHCDDGNSQLNNKSAKGTLLLCVEASFISAERGLHQGILSQTSLKCHI